MPRFSGELGRDRVIQIVVGSTNRAKIAAVRAAVARIWPKASVVGVEVPSGVSAQPCSDAEMIQGAENRARSALQATGADLGIGLEGGTIDTPHGMLVSGWVIALDRQGRRGTSCAGSLLLPPSIAQEVRQGRELGPVMDQFAGEQDTKHRQGAVGFLTGGLVNRIDAFERGVIYALAPFFNWAWYED